MVLTKKSVISILLAVLVCAAFLPQGADAAVKKGSRGFSGKTATSDSADKIIRIAKSRLGCPYVSGAAGPRSFDCSGFVAYCMKKSGIKFRRGTAASYYKRQYNVGSRISRANKGDIVLYSAGGGIGHCALYIGHGKVIHATCHGGIRITSYNGIGQRVVAVIRTYTPAGEAKISVKDSKMKVTGTKYLIFGKGVRKAVKVGKKGTADVKGLKTGKYKIKPLSVTKDFQRKYTKTVKIRTGKTTKIVFNNILSKAAAAGTEKAPAAVAE